MTFHSMAIYDMGKKIPTGAVVTLIGILCALFIPSFNIILWPAAEPTRVGGTTHTHAQLTAVNIIPY